MSNALPLDPVSADVKEKKFHTEQAAILRALAYFDLFDNPLRKEEFMRFGAHANPDPEALDGALAELRKIGVVQECDGFWGLSNTPRTVQERRSAETRAEARMPKARRMARLIGRFPFVRSVFVSGSLSKGRMAEDGDIDFFVITTPGRLWVARTLLILYKKIVLLNDRKDFCVNYLIDTDHLTIEDRNRFTATEIVTLLPMYGRSTSDAFFERNAWAFRMYPGAERPASLDLAIGRAPMKGRIEQFLSGRFGKVLDEWCMELTWRRWKRKFDHLDARSFELALRTRTYVSKHHPRNFQARVLDGYRSRLRALETVVGSDLS